jgi:predicted nucleotidyltransferase component of viral defense system
VAVKNRAASVLDRLKQKARTTGKPFQLYLQLFCQEEFLRRLSMSPFSDNLVLKGGLFIYALTNFESRSTVDIDFLMRHLPTDIQKMKDVIDAILDVNTGNDFIKLEAGNYGVILPRQRYKGTSFLLTGRVANTKTPFNVDIAVGDIVIPKPTARIIPAQLEDFSGPEVMTYSLESVIAEKFDAILERLELTSRLKDFYDIYYLSHVFDFEGKYLRDAIMATLKNRGTSFSPDSMDAVKSLTENGEMQIRWKRFAHRLNLTDLTFAEVLHDIDVFLSPLWLTIVLETEYGLKWSAKRYEWGV